MMARSFRSDTGVGFVNANRTALIVQSPNHNNDGIEPSVSESISLIVSMFLTEFDDVGHLVEHSQIEVDNPRAEAKTEVLREKSNISPFIFRVFSHMFRL
jgi:hypothetical protein